MGAPVGIVGIDVGILEGSLVGSPVGHVGPLVGCPVGIVGDEVGNELGTLGIEEGMLVGVDVSHNTRIPTSITKYSVIVYNFRRIIGQLHQFSRSRDLPRWRESTLEY